MLNGLTALAERWDAVADELMPKGALVSTLYLRQAATMRQCASELRRAALESRRARPVSTV